MKHHAKKRFGQNFLQDQQIISHIIDSISPIKSDNLVEIGPGQGALTKPLLQRLNQLHAVEIDRDLIPLIKESCEPYGNLILHQADALTFDFKTIQKPDEKIRIIGNLPYNISTPILFHLFQYKDIILDMHFMLQKEVVQRLAAQPGTGQYGRLTVMAQYHCKIDNLFEIPPSAFVPAPKVDSALVYLAPHTTMPDVAEDVRHLEILVRTAFSQRRKTIRNNLKKDYPDEAMTACNIDPKIRPECIPVSDYVKLSNYIKNI